MVDVGVKTDPADRALASLGGSTAVPRARDALDVILSGVRSSCWPDVAWSFSALTASGCPLEFSFCSRDPAIRYTAEVAGPEIGASDRLEIAAEMLAQLSPGARPPPSLSRELPAAQASGELGWGAWIGARHDASGSRYKLYVEMPRAGGDAARRLIEKALGAEQPLPHRRPRCEGVGYEPVAGMLELYFRVERLDVPDTGRLLVSCGLGRCQHDLLALMETVYARPMRPELPRHQFGFSITCEQTGRPVAATLFSYAVDVFGVDARARERVLNLGPTLGWTTDDYRHMSEPLQAVRRPPTHHTVVAFTVARDRPPALTIGLVPP